MIKLFVECEPPSHAIHVKPDPVRTVVTLPPPAPGHPAGNASHSFNPHTSWVSRHDLRNVTHDPLMTFYATLRLVYYTRPYKGRNPLLGPTHTPTLPHHGQPRLHPTQNTPPQP